MLLTDLQGKTDKNFDPSEFVKTVFFSFEELEEKILSKKITTAPGIIGYQWMKMHREVLEKL
ncbi:hypothetical protein ATW94_09565 [Oenococcus oeni]|nr:hypothetical protein ATW94_09565 [Oenococcus oeni]